MKGWEGLSIENWGGGKYEGHGWVALVKPPDGALLFYYVDNPFPMHYDDPGFLSDFSGDGIAEICIDETIALTQVECGENTDPFPLNNVGLFLGLHQN